jgi:hypothetical protein
MRNLFKVGKQQLTFIYIFLIYLLSIYIMCELVYACTHINTSIYIYRESTLYILNIFIYKISFNSHDLPSIFLHGVGDQT